MKRYLRLPTAIFLVIATFAGPNLRAQQIITLQNCYEAATQKSALSAEKASYSGISALKKSNISKGWLPTADLNGSFLYNSSVVDLSQALGNLPFPGIADAIKPLPHDQYKLTVDINQVIYDGGSIKGSRMLEDAELRVNEKQNEADLYKIRSQINTLYFGILLAERQGELLGDYLALLEKKAETMRSAFENGVIIRSDIDIIESERMKVSQQIAENNIRMRSLRTVLSGFTGMEISDSVKLAVPVFKQETVNEITRPELQLFDLKKEQLDAGMALTGSKRMPKAFGFATMGYGNPPGSNFFRDEFDTYYIIGAGIKWNIFDWNKAKNEKKIMILQKDLLTSRQADLSDNINRQLELKKSEIESLEKMVGTDDGIIELRKRISLSSESQYNNGTITITEYLGSMNAERQAVINREMHTISLALARVEYLNISGKEIEQ